MAALLIAAVFATTLGASIVHKEIDIDHGGVHYKIAVDAGKHHHGETDETNDNEENADHELSHHSHHHDEDEKHHSVVVHIQVDSNHEDHDETDEEHHELHQDLEHQDSSHQAIENYGMGQHTSKHHAVGDILSQYTHGLGAQYHQNLGHGVIFPQDLMHYQYPVLSHHGVQGNPLEQYVLGDNGLEVTKLGQHAYGTAGHHGNYIGQDLSLYGGQSQDGAQFHIAKHYLDQVGQHHGIEDEQHGVWGQQPSGNLYHVFHLEPTLQTGNQIVHGTHGTHHFAHH